MIADRVDAPESRPIPETVQELLVARIDALPDESRLVLQVAAVVGREASRRLLQAALDRPESLEAPMHTVVRLELLVEDMRRDDVVYVFKHPLIQEVAYETVLRRTRKELHRRVAEHLIATSPDAVQDISRHLVEAAELEMAFPYLIEAGLRSARSMALADAIRQLGLAVDKVAPGHGRLGTLKDLEDIIAKQAPAAGE